MCLHLFLRLVLNFTFILIPENKSNAMNFKIVSFSITYNANEELILFNEEKENTRLLLFYFYFVFYLVICLCFLFSLCLRSVPSKCKL